MFHLHRNAYYSLKEGAVYTAKGKLVKQSAGMNNVPRVK